MYNRPMRLFLPLLLWSTLVFAADDPWYTVEILVFAHLNQAAFSEEYWPDNPGMPALKNTLEAIRIAPPPGEPANGKPGSTDTRLAFTLLPKGQLQLSTERDYMRRSRYYRPLLHVAWRQPGFAPDTARALHVFSSMYAKAAVELTSGQRGALKPPRGYSGRKMTPLEGSVRLYRKRYLHIEADLRYTSRNRAVASPDGDATYSSFRLTESRRLRSGELHYFDHPLLGMLALVARDQPAAPAATPAKPPAPQPAVTSP